MFFSDGNKKNDIFKKISGALNQIKFQVPHIILHWYLESMNPIRYLRQI